MGTHPNAILAVALKPDAGSRKTHRAIMEEAGLDMDADIKIGGFDYHVEVMETDYDEGYQLAADEGDIVLFDMVTYGYGETIAWDEMVKRQAALKEWADGICERHKCTAKFFVTANYW